MSPPDRRTKAVDQGVAEAKDAITSIVLDYFEGWFDGDAARIERALHPRLVKRGIKPDGAILEITAQEMIAATREGAGRAQRPADLAIEVEVDQVYEAIANATVRSAVFIEYLQLARTQEGWRILNVLYVRRRTPA